jgi:hypothetical protein
MTNRGLIAASVAAVAAVMTAVTGTTTAAASPAGTGGAAAVRVHTRVLRDCVHPKREPARIIVTCGDGNVRAIQLHWWRWGARWAAGRGYMYINTCKPSCAGGTFKKYPARVTLTRPKASNVGKLFSKLTATFTHRSPFHARKHTWTLLTKPL